MLTEDWTRGASGLRQSRHRKCNMMKHIWPRTRKNMPSDQGFIPKWFRGPTNSLAAQHRWLVLPVVIFQCNGPATAYYFKYHLALNSFNTRDDINTAKQCKRVNTSVSMSKVSMPKCFFLRSFAYYIHRNFSIHSNLLKGIICFSCNAIKQTKIMKDPNGHDIAIPCLSYSSVFRILQIKVP